MLPKRILNSKQRTNLSNIKNSFLNGLTPAQIDTYIDNNVTDLTSAKIVLKKLGKVILYILKINNLQ